MHTKETAPVPAGAIKEEPTIIIPPESERDLCFPDFSDKALVLPEFVSRFTGNEQEILGLVLKFWAKTKRLDRVLSKCVEADLSLPELTRAIDYLSITTSSSNEPGKGLLAALRRSKTKLTDHWATARAGRVRRLRKRLEHEEEELRARIGEFTPGLHNLAYCTTTAEDVTPAGLRLWCEFSFRTGVTKENTLTRFKRVTGSPTGLDFLGQPDHGDHILKSRDAEISPITWANNWYTTENFENCSAIMFDIDEGTPRMDDCLDALQEQVAGVVWTSRNHQKVKQKSGTTIPACDRYHGILAIDRTISSVSEYRQIVAAFRYVLMPTGDPRMVVPTWKTRGGGEDSVITSLKGGNRCIDTNKLTELAKAFCPDYYDYCMQHVWSDGNGLDYDIDLGQIEEGQASQIQINQIERHYAKTTWTSDDTYRQVYGCACYAWSRCLHAPTVKASLLQVSVVENYLRRKPYQKQSFNGLLKRSLEAYLSKVPNTTHKKLIEPLNPVRAFSATSLAEPPRAYTDTVRRYCKLYKVEQTSAMEHTHKLVYSALTSREAGLIVNVPPGLCKTTGAICYTAAYASSNNKVVFVKSTLADCDKLLQSLLDLGADPDDMAMLEGYSAERCHFSQQHEPYFQRWKCNGCPRLSDTRYGEHIAICQRCHIGETHTNIAESMAKPIVILTHKRHMDWLAIDNTSSDRLYIVDESPPTYETYSLSTLEMERIAEHVPFAHEQAEWLKWMADLKGVPYTLPPLRDADSSIVKANISRLSALIHSATAKAYNPNWETDRDALLRYLQIFNGLGTLYVTGANQNYSFARSRLLNRCRGRTVILDGSAIYSNVHWDGFTIWELSEHQRLDFSNVVLHPIPGNPTQNYISKTWSAMADDVENFSKKNPNTCRKLALLQNKGAREKSKYAYQSGFRDKLKDAGVTVIDMYNGGIIGSNAGNDCDSLAVATSIFNNVAYYVLQTMLRTGASIDRQAIWSVRGTRGDTFTNGEPEIDDRTISPRMDENGFQDSRLNETYARQYAATIYQYILRTRARRYQGESVHAWGWVPGYWGLDEIRRMMPGIRVDGSGSGLLDRLRALDMNALEVMPDSELMNLAGIAERGNEPDIQRLRYAVASVWLEKRESA
jgi:hypothetical protein